MLVSLFRKLASGTGARSHRRIAIARAPRFESLEDRTVPAILALPITSLPTFSITLTLPGAAGGNTFANVPVSGGNFLGTYNTTALSSSYGLGPQSGIFVGYSYYSASENGNGITYGKAVPNAGSIAWLLANFGPAATSAGLQDALQAAIWRTEFGSNFELDGVDNSDPISPTSVNALIGPAYQAVLSALGNNTLPVSDVMWISPDSTEVFGSSQVEGLVALGPLLTPTQTAITSSVNPVAFGQSLTFRATVANTSSQGGTPTGSIQFQINGANYGKAVPLGANGTATMSGTGLNAGSVAVNAVYIPTGSFATSTSPVYKQTITPDVTAISVSSSVNHVRRRKVVNFLATVTNGTAPGVVTPFGTVVFKIDGKTRASVALANGMAVLSGIKLAPGKHTITVFYTPLNANFTASQGQLIA